MTRRETLEKLSELMERHINGDPELYSMIQELYAKIEDNSRDGETCEENDNLYHTERLHVENLRSYFEESGIEWQ